MAVQNDLKTEPVLLGQRTLQMAPGKCSGDKDDLSAKLENGRCRWLPLRNWFKMLYATFGSFLPLVMLCYGLQSNFALTSTHFACKYYMMDELKLDGVMIGRLMTAAYLPWNMKPLLGLLSDAVPLCGYHRTSYLVSMLGLSILLYTWVGLSALSALGLAAFLILQNTTVAFSDVVVDGTTATLARNFPAQACDLQTAIRSADATCGIVASALKGTLVSNLAPRGTVWSNALISLAVLIPALRGWLPEDRLPGKCCQLRVKVFHQNPRLTLGATFLALLATTLSGAQTFLTHWQQRAAALLACATPIVVCVYQIFSRVSPYLWKTAMILFLRGCFQPGLGESMFVWMSKDPNGPLFSPELVGLADCFGDVGLLFGVLIFNKVLRKWKYWKIFFLMQSLVIFASVMDLILVMRWNRRVGLPDIFFFLGDQTFTQAVDKTFMVPVVVLAYKLCPANLEATIFSTLMATTNMGVVCGNYFGVTLAEMWGVEGGNFEHLPHGIISKSLIRLLPLPLILLLSPDFTPDDVIPMGTSCEEQGSE